jgi:hypothetical protein
MTSPTAMPDPRMRVLDPLAGGFYLSFRHEESAGASPA